MNRVLGKLGAALGGISAPVLAVVAVIAVLVAAFVHLWKTNEGFRDAIIGTWNRIKDTISGFCQGIVDRLNALGFQFTDIVDVLKTVWDGFCQVLAPIFEGVFNNIANILSTVTGVITGILDVFIGIFTGNWSQAWTGVKEIFLLSGTESVAFLPTFSMSSRALQMSSLAGLVPAGMKSGQTSRLSLKASGMALLLSSPPYGRR